ncbi:MAG: MFS transporter [Gammaproteobacteria bacterium]|nr:MFS transporter [Gammaproteobacteria bacterium]MDH5302625.1 MFS transporter [Gammaproteobacteria bacterium]MDH5322138.1 MFS transporter [Gammaproteobacteria bacterium]
MRKELAPVATLLIGVSILLTGQGLQGTLLPVRASLEAFSTLAIAVMGAAYFLGFTVGCIKGGELVKRVGHVRVFLAMTSLASAVPLLHGMLLDPVTWTLLRLLTGFCFAVLYLVIESWLNEQSDNASRGIVFSTYVMITLTVFAAGQMMTLLYDPKGLELFLIAAVLVSLGAVPVALSESPTPTQPLQVELNLKRLFEISPAGTIGCFAHGVANGAFWSLAPVFTLGVSSDPSLAAWFMTSAVAGGAIAQWPLGYISDRIGRRKTLACSAVTCAAVAAAILVLASSASFVAINLLAAAWGFFAFPLYTIAVAHANDKASVDDYVMVSSGLLLMFGAGAVVGPFIASAVMTLSGPYGLYWLTAAVHLLLALYVMLRIVRRPSAPTEQHIAFSDALAITHTASHVFEEEIQHKFDD